MNKYILVLALVAALGAIVSDVASNPFGSTDSPVVPVAGEYEDEVLNEEEDRALSERNDDDEEEEEEDVDNSANQSPNLLQRFKDVDIVAFLTKSDEVETAELRKKPEDFEKHAQKCYQVRDDVNRWVIDSLNSQASWAMQVVGTLFFDTAKTIGDEGNKAVAEGAELVKQDARKFIDGMQIIVDALRQTILTLGEKTVENFQKGINMDSFGEIAVDACQEVERKKKQFDKQFGDRDWIKLGCVTVRRVKITDRLCSVFRALKPFLNGFTD